MNVLNLSKLTKKNDEIRTPARAVYVEKACPECKLGRMVQTGRAMQPAPGMPPIFEHICDKCQHTEGYGKQYPRVDFMKVDAGEDGVHI